MRSSAIVGLSAIMAGVLASGVFAGRLAGQSAAQLALGGGSVTDVRGVTSTAVSVAPSLAFTSRGATLRLGASGTRFLAGSWAAGAGASLNLRHPAGRMAALTLGTSTGAAISSYAVSSTLLEVTPAIEVGSQRVAGFLGVTGAASRTTAPRIATVFEPSRLSSASHVAFGPVFGARITLASWRESAIGVGYRQWSARVDDVPVVDRVASLTLGSRSVSVTGLLGQARAPGERDTYGGIRALVSVSRPLALQFGAESQPRNRLTGSLPGRVTTLGIVLRTSSRPAPPRATTAPAADRPGSR